MSTMPAQLSSNVTITGPPPETVAYLDAHGEQLYCVHHHAVAPQRAAVLLAGSIGAERERAWRTTVLLARHLAECGFETLRFDYRGMGESEGLFENYCLSDWREDVERCAEYVGAHAPNGPLLLCGTRAGCMPVGECFRDGCGDSMLMLAPPAGGREFLMDTMRRTLMADMLAHPNQPRQTREEIAAQLESDCQVNVDGYFWSPRLWRESLQHVLLVPAETEPRPWGILDFRGLPPTKLPAHGKCRAVSTTSERFWEHSPQLVPASNRLFDTITEWIEKAVEAKP
jgi:hypothetical protein